MGVLQTMCETVGAATHAAVDAGVANRVDGSFAGWVRAWAFQKGAGLRETGRRG